MQALCAAIAKNAETDALHDVMWEFYCKAPGLTTETVLACALIVFGSPGHTWLGPPLLVLDAVRGPLNPVTNLFARGDSRKQPWALHDISCALAPDNYKVLMQVADILVQDIDIGALSVLGPWHPLLLDAYPFLWSPMAPVDVVSQAIVSYKTFLRSSRLPMPSAEEKDQITEALSCLVPSKSADSVWSAIVYYVHRREAPPTLKKQILLDFALLSVCWQSRYLLSVVKWVLG